MGGGGKGGGVGRYRKGWGGMKGGKKTRTINISSRPGSAKVYLNTVALKPADPSLICQ